MSDKLRDFSIEELQQEIKRRITNKPKLKQNIDWNIVIRNVENNIINDTIKDYEHYLFKNVMECMFGKSFWDWWNHKQNTANQSDQ